MGYQQVTVQSTAASTLTVPNGANLAVICATAQNVRMRDDGTSATSATGVVFVTNQPFTYDGELTKVTLAAETGTAVVEVTYYKAV